MAPTQLYIFDFDQTLVFTPPPETGMEVYFRATGKSWDWPGWWGRAESLCPPVLLSPVDKSLLNEALATTLSDAFANPDVEVFVLTGRHHGLHSHVCRILEEVGLGFLPKHHIVCKTGGQSTADFKMACVEKWVKERPSVSRVTMWDDREPHVEIFRSTLADRLDALNRAKLTVHLVIPSAFAKSPT